jgi:thioredoxin reductase (NADPH)
MNDFVIIGAGPIGLYGAYLAGLRGLKGCVLESLPFIGGQLTTLYPEKLIYDLPGFVGVQASTFIQTLYAQYERFRSSIPIHVSEAATSILDREDGTYRVTTSTGGHFDTRYVIFTSGIGRMTPKLLDAQFLPHPRIQYRLNDPSTYTNHDVIILGGGNTALDYANTLVRVARSVSLVHRRDVFKAFESSLMSFQQCGGRVYVPYELKTYRAINDALLLTLMSPQTNATIELQTHHVLVCYGYGTNLTISFHPHLTFAPKKHTFDQHKLMVNAQYQTSLPHVYAAGDAITYVGKANHISQGFGEVTTIMELIHHELFPAVKIPHSSFMVFDIKKTGTS